MEHHIPRQEVVYVLRSYNLYPFIAKGYLINTHFPALGSNLNLSQFNVNAKHRHQNAFKWSKEWDLEYKNSYADILESNVVEVMLIKCVGARTHSPKSLSGNEAWFLNDIATFKNIDVFFHKNHFFGIF